VSFNLVKDILSLSNISKSFFVKKSVLFSKKSEVKALRNISLNLIAGENLGIIGESGSGKSTLAKIIVGLLNKDSGDLLFRGEDITTRSIRERSKLIQYVFQDPVSSLNPSKTILQSLMVPIKSLLGIKGSKGIEYAGEILSYVQMGKEVLTKYPHELSGGQAQRVCIARALLAKSPVVVLDEPVSALDVIIQAQILELLNNLKHDFQLTYLIISHDLAVVESFCDRVGVMYEGKILELDKSENILGNPGHPYTKLLIDSVPRPKFR
jgi:peptide/nickel transport system ATP-binding protein